MLGVPTCLINSEVKQTLDTHSKKLMKQEIAYFLSINDKKVTLISITFVKRQSAMNSFSIKTQYPLLAFCNTQESQQRKENF